VIILEIDLEVRQNGLLVPHYAGAGVCGGGLDGGLVDQGTQKITRSSDI